MSSYVILAHLPAVFSAWGMIWSGFHHASIASFMLHVVWTLLAAWLIGGGGVVLAYAKRWFTHVGIRELAPTGTESACGQREGISDR
nr:hypothetical protein [Kibdelosporangium sp. MJ126-NF4]CEL23490.1 hypothetical protein [Kibdelosporangium sp. MJ126-NF4]CTQ89104.1 hypothetical protein [Kibdelosporangium sp. MJ126-NF4]